MARELRDAIAEASVDLTLVGGRIVYDRLAS
jgi:hypothetical protein